MYLFNTDTSLTYLIAYTCTTIDTYTVEDGPIEIPCLTIYMMLK